MLAYFRTLVSKHPVTCLEPKLQCHSLASVASYTPLTLGRAELDGNGYRQFPIPKNLRFAPGPVDKSHMSHMV